MPFGVFAWVAGLNGSSSRRWRFFSSWGVEGARFLLPSEEPFFSFLFLSLLIVLFTPSATSAGFPLGFLALETFLEEEDEEGEEEEEEEGEPEEEPRER